MAAELSSTSSSVPVLACTLPRNTAITAVRANATDENTQPWRRLSTTAVGDPLDGLPTMMTRIAMPSTAPIWRALEFTAEAVANRPPGTAARAALPEHRQRHADADPAEHLSGEPGAEEIRRAGTFA